MAAEVRVRFAPSPTGFLHVGGARTALFNWLFARHHQGTFVLRVEDTDRERSTEDSTRAIYEGMSWLGLDWDEGPDVGGPHGPYVQTERKEIYQRSLERLRKSDRVYSCFCTPEELKTRREAAQKEGRTPGYDGRCRGLDEGAVKAARAAGTPEALRLRVEAGETAWNDLIKGEVRFDNANLEDFVIMKSDGHPTYNFAVVVDDAEMEITHVIRGDDHTSNTPRQILLYRALGHDVPEFAHLPMILGSDGTRLSKRHGATAVGSYQELGLIPEAMVNYLALLGWSLDGETEIFTREDLIEHFSLKRVGSTPSIFDLTKLQWMNGVHLRRMAVDRRVRLAGAFLTERGLWPQPGHDDAFLDRLVLAIGDRLKVLPDVEAYGGFALRDEIEFDPKALKKMTTSPDVEKVFARSREVLAGVEPFRERELEAALSPLAEELGLRAGQIYQPLRVAVTGKTVSPGIFETLALAGRERCLTRLEKAASLLAAS